MIPLVACLTLPLIAAMAAVALPAGARVPAALIGTALTLAATIWLALTVWQGGPVLLSPGGWAPPVGIALRADGLSAALAVMAALVMTATALAIRAEHAMTGALPHPGPHARPQPRPKPQPEPKPEPKPQPAADTGMHPGPHLSAGTPPRARQRPSPRPAPPSPRLVFGIWPLILLLWAALNAVFVSRDLFNLYVGLELISLSAVALVAISGKAQAIAAGLRYLFFALAGSLLYLAGVALAYSTHGTLDIGLLAARAPAPGDALALGLMTAGLLAKTAIFPFHVWLPPAHAAAPAPASALLSALVPKASLLILLRLWFEAMPDSATPAALMVLAGLGALAVIWGGVMALVQARLKLIVAYSTVAQLGYVFLVFPLAGGAGASQPPTAMVWTAGAWTGAAFQILSHGLAKAAMFLTAGICIAAVGSDRLRDLRGLARALPMTGAAFALAAVTLTGLPPSGGFTAKYLMMTSAFASGQWPWAAVLVGGGLLAVAYLYRPMAVLFARHTALSPRAIPRSWQAIPLVLAALSVALGLMSAAPFDLLQAGRPGTAAEGS